MMSNVVAVIKKSPPRFRWYMFDQSNLKGSIAFTDGIYDEDEKIVPKLLC